jgi:hypothetical protein
MKENVISRNVQLEIMKFFLKTSVPRIMESNIKPV